MSNPFAPDRPPVLPESDPAELEYLARTACKLPLVSNFPGWEDRLRKSRIVELMRTQFQRRNDCQGQAVCNGIEARDAKLSGVSPRQRADSYVYMACELIDQGRIGRDAGTTISSGVKLQVEGAQKFGIPAGVPLEEVFPYDSYHTKRSNFANVARTLQMHPTHLTEHMRVPDFESTLCSLAAGGVIHMGKHWPNSNSSAWGRASNGMRELVQVPGGGGGHATCGIHAIELSPGDWRIFVWNSHGEGQHYLIGERVWNALADQGFQPFGGFLLMPDKPEERYADAAQMHGRIFV